MRGIKKEKSSCSKRRLKIYFITGPRPVIIYADLCMSERARATKRVRPREKRLNGSWPAVWLHCTCAVGRRPVVGSAAAAECAKIASVGWQSANTVDGVPRGGVVGPLRFFSSADTVPRRLLTTIGCDANRLTIDVHFSAGLSCRRRLLKCKKKTRSCDSTLCDAQSFDFSL